jgi:hypothetical protein
MRQAVLVVAFCAALTLAATATARPLPRLSARGTDVVDPSGRVVYLRGTNLGYGFLYEQWATGMAADAELSLWRILGERFGPGKLKELQRVWRESWIGEDDVAAAASLGMACLRLPFGWWLLEDEARPGQWLEDGFAQLDRVVGACEKHGVYVLLDLHGAPGGQSAEHHTGVVGKNELWSSAQDQERTIAIWRELARRYRGRTVIAGYDLLNEPMGAPSVAALLDLYDRIYRAIREVDPATLIFLEDGYKGWENMPPPADRRWQGVVYSPHFYPRYWNGWFTSEKDYEGLVGQLWRWRDDQLKRLKVPVVVGEFSVWSSECCDGPKWLRRYIAELSKMDWGWLTFCWKMPREKPDEDLWGVVDRPRGGHWTRPDIVRDDYGTLLKGFRRFSLRHWDYSPLVKPIMVEGLHTP